MEQYLNLLKDIRDQGTWKSSGRGNMPKTKSLFGRQLRFDLQEGFPLITTKKISFKNIVTELLWFLRGDTNIKFLVNNGCNIWNEDAYNYLKKISNQHRCDPMSFDDFLKHINIGNVTKLWKDQDYKLGDCGMQYGKLWRKWPTIEYDDWSNWRSPWGPGTPIDQIQKLIDGLMNNPESRRHIITAWNPDTLNEMALPACHSFVQFNCRPLEVVCDDLGMTPKYRLDCKFTMRSSDAFLGLPYNIASYGLLVHIFCRICNMVPGDLVADLGDVHIYEDHFDAMYLQLNREPRKLPRLRIREDLKTLEDFEMVQPIFYQDDFILEGYDPHPTIKAKLSTGLK